MLLAVRGLSVGFTAAGGIQPVVEDLSLQVAAGEAVAVVGESGCGKSVTARALLRLLPEPPARILAGEVRLGGRSVLDLPQAELRALRGREVGFVFQDPMTALNPVFPVGEQIAERLRWHAGMGRAQARDQARALLAQVGIPDAAARARAWPHQLSGGMRQRVVIAIALACDPALLIADEPTTALDVTLQAQILALLARQRAERDMGLLLITHDLGVVAGFVDRVVVMYAGQVVEEGSVLDVFDAPRHPYTRGLLRAVPGTVPPGPDRRLWSIPGVVPAPGAWPPGCRFAPRCERVRPDCRGAPVPLIPGPGGSARCLYPYEERLRAAAASH